MYQFEKPLIALSEEDKNKDNKLWYKDNINFILRNSYFTILPTINNTLYKRNLQLLYNVYNNQIEESIFNYVSNPLNTTKGKNRNFPARIRPYNIIRENIDIFLGEFTKRYFNYIILNEGEEAYNKMLEQRKAVIYENVNQHFINALNEMGVDTGEQSQEVQLPEEVFNKFNSSYRDIYAIQSQKWIKKFEKREYIKEIVQDLFKDWCIAGESYSYKNFENGKVIYQRVSPLYCDYDKSMDVKYIEDGSWFSRAQVLTFSDIIENFYSEIENEEEFRSINSASNFPAPVSSTYLNYFLTNREMYKPKYTLFHAVWKSQEEIKILSRLNDYGEIEEIEVDSEYKLNKELGDIEIKKQYVNSVYEGYRLGLGFKGRTGDDEKGEIFFRLRKCPVQRRIVNNRAECKLPYNGKRWSDTNALNTSLTELGLPYQILFIIIQWKIELALAKSKMFVLMDMNTIPNKEGWDEEKTIYYAEALGYFFIDRNKIGVDKTFNQYQTVNLLQYEHINQLIQIQDFIIRRWDSLCGISPERKGRITTDTASQTQASIFQSSIISEKTYIDFEQFVEKEYQGFIDYGKYEIASGDNKIVELNDDSTVNFFEIDPVEYCSSDLSIFAVNSSLEQDKLRQLKELSARLSGNPNIKTSTLAELIGAENASEVKNILKSIEAKDIEIAEMQSKNEHEREVALENLKKEFLEYQSMLKINEMNAEQDRLDQREYIKGDIELSKSGMIDSNQNNIPDINEIENRALKREEIYLKKQSEREKVLHDKDINMRKLGLEAEKNSIEREKIQMEKYKADMSLKVAKENKTRAELSKKKK